MKSTQTVLILVASSDSKVIAEIVRRGGPREIQAKRNRWKMQKAVHDAAVEAALPAEVMNAIGWVRKPL